MRGSQTKSASSFLPVSESQRIDNFHTMTDISGAVTKLAKIHFGCETLEEHRKLPENSIATLLTRMFRAAGDETKPPLKVSLSDPVIVQVSDSSRESRSRKSSTSSAPPWTWTEEPNVRQAAGLNPFSGNFWSPTLQGTVSKLLPRMNFSRNGSLMIEKLRCTHDTDMCEARKEEDLAHREARELLIKAQLYRDSCPSRIWIENTNRAIRESVQRALVSLGSMPKSAAAEESIDRDLRHVYRADYLVARVRLIRPKGKTCHEFDVERWWKKAF